MSSLRTTTCDAWIVPSDYWDIVGDDIIRGNGPTAVASRLGYFLSGSPSESAIDRTSDQLKSKRRKKKKKR